MAITDRKLFRNPRPARDTLNRMGGIMASSAPLMNQVQRFQNGGSVVSYGNPMSPSYITSLTGKKYYVPGSASSPSEASLLDLTKRATEGGLGALSASERMYLQTVMGGEQALNATQGIRDYLGDSTASDIIGGAASGLGTLFSGVGSVGTELLIDEEGDQTTLGGRLASLMPSEEFLKSIGFTELGDRPTPPAASSPAEASRPMFQGPTQAVNVDMSDPAVRARIADEQRARAISDAGGMVNVDPTTGAVTEGPTDDIQQLIEMSQAAALEQASVPDELQTERFDNQQQVDELSTQPFGGESKKPASSIPVPTPRPDNFAALVAASRAKTDEATAAREKEEDRMRQGQLGTIQPRTEEEIANVINNGTKEEQQSELKQLMNEFTQNAPKYEGVDKGLAIAKIGFAMAAGKSPDAIQNIASALEDGADIFIKDKQQRDAFNRQVELSALQYGLGEVGKKRADERAISRERRGTKKYTFGPEGGTYKGRAYEPYADVEVSVGDIRDNKMPTGLVSSAMVTALATRAKTTAALQKAKFDAGQISMSELSKQQENYTTAVDNVIKSEQAVDLLEDVMVDVAKGEVTGFKPAALDFFNKVGNFAGFDFGKKYETKDQARSAMRQALQLMIPNTVGSTQSANSISNRDVDFLITAYFGEGALDGGPFTFAATDKNTMVKRLQNAAIQMRDAQKKDFAQMKLVETNLSSVYQPGTEVSALGGLSPARARLLEKGLLPGQLNIRTTIGVTKGDDGVLRFN